MTHPHTSRAGEKTVTPTPQWCLERAAEKERAAASALELAGWYDKWANTSEQAERSRDRAADLRLEAAALRNAALVEEMREGLTLANDRIAAWEATGKTLRASGRLHAATATQALSSTGKENDQ